jgi:hypothetical protein
MKLVVKLTKIKTGIERLKQSWYIKGMKGFSVKNDKKIQVMLEGEEKMVITAFDDLDLHQVGYLNFKIDKGRAYLSSIKVTDIDFLRTGVGSVMIGCFETYCKHNRVNYIDGRFYPNGDGGIFAREFYEEHGYTIYRDGYEQYITKDLTYIKADERFAVGQMEVEEISDVYENIFLPSFTASEDIAQGQ